MKNGDQPIYPDPMRGAPQSFLNQNPDALPAGLTKREYFAGLVLKGLLSNTDLRIQNYESIVSFSLVYTDELLKQLENETTK